MIKVLSPRERRITTTEVPKQRRIVGILPAAGKSTRMGGLFKELLPMTSSNNGDSKAVRPIIDISLHQMIRAGTERIYIITSPEKVMSHMTHLGDGSILGVPIVYLCQKQPLGLGNAVLAAEKLIEPEDLVCFMMPDTLIKPHDALRHLVSTQQQGRADLVLGAHKVRDPQNFGVIDFDGNGRPKAIIDKPKRPRSNWVWTCAVFTARLFDEIHKLRDNGDEIQLTDAFNISLRRLRVNVVRFRGIYLDIGTYEGYLRAARWLS